MARNKGTIKWAGFRGLQTKNHEAEVGFGGLVTARNVDISRKHKISRRAGHTQVKAGTFHAAWSDDEVMLLQAGLDVVSFDGADTKVVFEGSKQGDFLAAYRLGYNVYASNGFDTFVYPLGHPSARTLGLERPSKPGLTAVAGTLQPGNYQVALTFVRDDGQQSGSSTPGYITLTAVGGIEITVPVSNDQSVAFVDVWVTATNGTELYKAARVLNGDPTASFVGPTTQLQEPLRTLNLQAPPVFQAIDFYGSRMLYGCDDLLVFSDPFAYEHVNMTKSYVPFGARITMIAGTTGGVFVGTDKDTRFLACDDVSDATMDVVGGPAVFGTLTYVDGHLLGDGKNADAAPLWVSDEGICIGEADGSVRVVTERSVQFEELAVRGSAVFRKKDGQHHYVAVVNS